jgi:hypothetical protein
VTVNTYYGPPPTPPSRAHLDPRYDRADYASPRPPPTPFFDAPPPRPRPEMIYGPPPPQQPPWVLLGFRSQWSSQIAVYGPAGAEFVQSGTSGSRTRAAARSTCCRTRSTGSTWSFRSRRIFVAGFTIGLGPGRITIGIRPGVSRDLSRIDRRLLVACSRGL